MAAFYLSSIAHLHGTKNLVRELDEVGADNPRLLDDGLESYGVTTMSSIEMAGEVGARALAGGLVPDAIVYATETADGDGVRRNNVRLARAVDAPGAATQTVAGHGCANLGLLLGTVQGLFATTDVDTVLVVTADRVVGRGRMMDAELSVLSDGAAAALVTRHRPAGDGLVLLVNGMALRSDWRGDLTDNSPAAQRRNVLLGRSAVKAAREATGRGPRDFTHALFNNYRLPAQRFLTGAAGYSFDQLLPGRLAAHAHEFAADLLVNADLLAADGVLTAGDRLALVATGPHSWAVIDAEVVG
ncbi:hypothetical protein AB0K25_23425 [Micromonospora sp. NPDC049257]|uniref:hypothetical protein n=1 Tax=Micromonospora sp. NPDC049257 TaxID=3155771 RepID=UPI00342EB5FE